MGFATKLLGTGIATAITATVGTLATDPNTAWYKTRKKPDWQPPNLVFPIAWTGLYATIAGSSAKVLANLDEQEERALTETRREEIRKERRSFKRSLGINLTLNAGWSILFWQGRNLKVATVEAAALAVSSACLMRRAGKVSTGAGAALVPYTAWTTFATTLTGKIAQLNE